MRSAINFSHGENLIQKFVILKHSHFSIRTKAKINNSINSEWKKQNQQERKEVKIKVKKKKTIENPYIGENNKPNMKLSL